jgi:hypothetical protein
MLGLLIFLGIILVLILINKNTKSSPDGPGCIEQGCAILVILFVIAVVVPDCARRQQAQYEFEQRMERRAGTATQGPRMIFNNIKISDAANPSVHRASFDATTLKIIVNCYVGGAVPGTPLTVKWFHLGSGTRQLLKQATVNATSSGHPAFFSAARRSDQLWPVGRYEVELYAGNVLCQTLTYWVTSKPEPALESSNQEPEAPAGEPDHNRRMWDPND